MAVKRPKKASSVVSPASMALPAFPLLVASGSPPVPGSQAAQEHSANHQLVRAVQGLTKALESDVTERRLTREVLTRLLERLGGDRAAEVGQDGGEEVIGDE